MNGKVNDYETPTIQVINMVNDDVITTSGAIPGPDVDLGGEA